MSWSSELQCRDLVGPYLLNAKMKTGPRKLEYVDGSLVTPEKNEKYLKENREEE